MATYNPIPVFAIERLRIGLDGQGVRTLIGTAGCPLHCQYCLNPQSWNGTELFEYYTPEQLYEKVKMDSLYFEATGGGLTIGGGEPLLHMGSLARLATFCPATWSLWVETSLYAKEEAVLLAAGIFDHFLVDIKTTNPDIYRRYTGGDVSVALENLKYLLDLVGPERITVRLPQIPGYVTAENCTESEKLLRAMGIQNMDYLVYEKGGIF